MTLEKSRGFVIIKTNAAAIEPDYPAIGQKSVLAEA